MAQKWIGSGLKYNRIVGESRVATVRYRAQLRQFDRGESTGEIPRTSLGQDCVDWARSSPLTSIGAQSWPVSSARWYSTSKVQRCLAETGESACTWPPGILARRGLLGVRLSWRRRMRCFPIPHCTCSGRVREQDHPVPRPSVTRPGWKSTAHYLRQSSPHDAGIWTAVTYTRQYIDRFERHSSAIISARGWRTAVR